MLSMSVVVHYYDSCCKLKVLLVPQTLLNIIKKKTHSLEPCYVLSDRRCDTSVIVNQNQSVA